MIWHLSGDKPFDTLSLIPGIIGLGKVQIQIIFCISNRLSSVRSSDIYQRVISQ